jgi:hypothetical protein
MKKCKQCSSEFSTTDKNRQFYKKIASPEPTLCPNCRHQRRLAVRNETNFYRGECKMCQKKFISIYSPDKPYIQVCNDCFFSDKWDPKTHGREYDFSKSFFEQFDALRKKIPRINNGSLNCINCDYTNFAGDCKNCYLIVAAEKSEDCYYSKLCQYNSNCIDSDYIWKSELCYDCTNVTSCYHCISTFQLEDCNNCYFSFDLKGCSNCLFCHNLRNHKYQIENKPVSKEEFEEEVRKLQLHTYSGRQKAYSRWIKMMRENAIHKHLNIINCENSSGDDLKNCNNMKECFDMQNSENCSYCWEGDAKFTQDCNNLYYSPELCYEIVSMLANYNSKFTMYSHYCSDIQYCDLCYYSKNLFGCIGIIRGEYCILNKQYTKEEYEKLLPKIIEKMKSDGEYGEFFPQSISPFAYNETVAQEHFPLNKEEIISRGWKWKDKNDTIAKNTKIIHATKLPEDIKEIPDAIMEWAIECEETGRPFKIIPQELNFYRKNQIPISHLHPDQRHKKRMELKNPRKLFERNCHSCHTTISTTYHPNRKEKVYCEKCYLKEVY